MKTEKKLNGVARVLYYAHHHYHCKSGHGFFVKRHYWQKRAVVVNHHTHVTHIAKFKGKSHSLDKLEKYRKAANAAAAAYRLELLSINGKNQHRYHKFLMKLASERKTSIKMQEKDRTKIEVLIRTYEAKLRSRLHATIVRRRMIEAKKIAAIR